MTAVIAKELEHPGRADMARPLTLLVVDDDAAIIRYLKELLGDEGHQIDAFTDSTEALDAFRASPARYDAIVTDQTMPALTGTEMLKLVRAVKPAIPVIICSGYADIAKRDAFAERSEGVVYLTKPVSVPDLLSALEIATSPLNV